MSESLRLAEFVSATRYEDVPRDVVEKTRALLLDQLGAQLAGASLPWSRAVHALARDEGGREEATVVGHGTRLPAAATAFVNGTFGHAFEIDDSLRRAVLHPGCVISAAALATAERQGSDGRSYLLAAALGFEVMARVGIAVAPSLAKRGHHPTATVGTFGSAAAAGVLLGLDVPTLLNAFSLAGGFSSGLIVGTGGEQKRLYGGVGAAGGVRAALLAHAGITGSPTPLEGTSGFGRAFSDTFRAEDLVDGLGEAWRLHEIVPKYYPVEGQVHPIIDATARIMERRPVAPDEIESIEIGVSSMIVDRPANASPEPKDLGAAQFSGPFAVALRIVRGANDVSEYVPERLHDESVLAVSRKARQYLDPEVDAGHPKKRGARVRVHLVSGETLEEYVDDMRVLDAAETREKSLGLARTAVSGERVAALTQLVDRLEHVESVRDLAAATVADEGLLDRAAGAA